MAKLALSLLCTFVVFSCNNLNQKIEIDPTISFSIPQKNELTVKDSSNYLKIWETTFEDDRVTVFKYSVNQGDTLNYTTLRQYFKKNVDAFLKPFDLMDLDSTLTSHNEYFQTDLTFDYMSKGEKYKFFGNFVGNGQSFIAFCFHTPFPFDNNSKSFKDKIFNSIEVR
jgi:hypothetical protein